MRGLVLRLLRALAGLFYRRIETAGFEHVPREGPVLLIANHNNGLVDPMLVLSVLSRPVVFVAKSTLWRIPLLAPLLDLLGCVPVIRKKEAAGEISSNGEERNSASFERLAGELRRGGCVLIFPEGRSHSDPRISGLRTGAARILLLSKVSSVVVPVGLWFEQKEIFRSDVLVKAGAPVPPPVDPTVESWTEAMGKALEAVTLNADDWKDHELVAAVGALYGRSVEKSLLEGEEGAGVVERSFRVRQLLLRARTTLEKTHPDEVRSVARRTFALDRLLRRIALSCSSLDDPPPARTILRHTMKALAVIILGFPVAVLGVAAWWVPYRLCGAVANRVPGAATERDQIALYKLLAGVVLFPLALAIWTAAAWVIGGALWGALALVSLPFAGVSSLLFFEYATWREQQARELLALLLRPGGLARLRAERDALVAECDRLATLYVTAVGENPSR
ncbi:MAG: 1-acyl-sn-glycerol-3-phosphate acyltransferase [Thermoanaerobaculia bacterium]